MKNDLENCIKTLKKGGTILYPTDTIWGIGCDATNEKAIKEIFEIKDRPKEKSMIILLANVEDLKLYVDDDLKYFEEYYSTINRPTTFIFQKGKNLAKSAIHKNGTVAIRIVNDDFCKKLITEFGKPIVSTSANLSGEIAPKNFSEIAIAIKVCVDYVVHHRQNDDKEYQPSKIVKLKKNGKIEVIRE